MAREITSAKAKKRPQTSRIMSSSRFRDTSSNIITNESLQPLYKDTSKLNA
jgi:hypothetical protein